MPTSKESVIKSLIGIKNLGATTLDTAYDEFGLRTLDDLIALAESGKLATIKGVGPVRAKSVLESARAMKANPPKAKGKRGRKPGSKNKPKGAKAKPAVAAKTVVATDAVPPMVRPGGKKDAAVAATPIVKPVPKPRGRPRKEAVAADATAPRPTPKPRGRPKKADTVAKAAPQPKAIPKKRGRPKKVVETPTPAADKKRNKPGPKPGSTRTPAAAPKAEAPRAEAPKAERPRPQSTYTPPAPQKSSNPVVFLGKLVFKIAKKLLS